MATIPLTRQSVNKIGNNLKTQIQVGKVNASKGILYGLQNGRAGSEPWPPTADFTAYVTSTSAKNRYPDLNNFWKRMEKAPKYWKNKFIYVAAEDEELRIQEAAAMAIDLVQKQTRAYPQPDKNGQMHTTGHLYNSIKTYVNRVETSSPLLAIGRAPEPPVFQIVNIAEYGSTAEAYAYYSALKGIIFYAANKVQKAYPDLGVVYAYAKAADYAPHIYDIPVLSIGPKEYVNGQWSRPGSRIKRRKRFIAKQKREGRAV
jgi:hypothetical protein